MSDRQHFRGQLGINSTPLSLAILAQDFTTAEEIVRSGGDVSILNDGAYEDIPLRLCLSLKHSTVRNLHLANMLVEAGADPNLGPPANDREFASPSPFQELVVYHELLRAEVAGVGDRMCQSLDMYYECDESRITFLTNTVDLTGAQLSATSASCQDLLHQTGKLIQTFLTNGADPNLFTTFKRKSLFHWVVERGDMNLITQLLSTTKVNMNRSDLHGNTPLMDAIMVFSPNECLQLYNEIKSSGYCPNPCSKNCCGETPLSLATFVGATGLAAKLVDDGAKVKAPSSHTRGHTGCYHYYRRLPLIPALGTPLLAPLLIDSPPRMRYEHVPERENTAYPVQPHKHLIDKIISAAISPLLDVGCLDNVDVAQHIEFHLPLTNFEHLEEELTARDLQVLMFGKTCAGLKQLCVRTVYDKAFPYLDGSTPSHSYCGKDCEEAMNKEAISKTVDALGLPQSMSVFFEVEAAKYQLCGMVSTLLSVHCYNECSESEGSITDDSDEDDTSNVMSDFSEYPDSLLFFSSDMLSEESSAEVEDLSDEEVEEGAEKADYSCDSQEEEREAQDEEEECGHRTQTTNSCAQSKNFQVMVEMLCEDIAEGGVCPPCPDPAYSQNSTPDQNIHYQRFSDESTASIISAITESPSHNQQPLPDELMHEPDASPLPSHSLHVPGDSPPIPDSPPLSGDSPLPGDSSPILSD